MTVQGRLEPGVKLSPDGKSLIQFLSIDNHGNPSKIPIQVAEVTEDGVRELSQVEIAQSVVNMIESTGGDIETEPYGVEFSMFSKAEVAVLTGKPFEIKQKEEK